MKASEFVKLRGISYCNELLIKADGCAAIRVREDNSRVSVDDLKRLVESHELVEYMGGIDKAKEQAYVLAMEVDGFNPTKIEKAIADVESCHVD